MMRNRSAIAAAAVSVVLIGFVFLLATSDTQQSGSSNFEIMNKVGPQIEGPTLDGGEYALWDERGDWVVVNFFASWCVGCRVEHPELVELSERGEGDNLQVVSVMFSDTEERAREFFDELGGDWPVLVTDTGSVAIDYSVTAVPETVLISPSGRVVYKWVGASGVTADGIEDIIRQLTEPAIESEDAN